MEREPLGAAWRGSVPFQKSLLISIWLCLVLLSLPLLGLSGIAQANVHITSITPSCAVAGEHLTLTGRGFGATNVTVTVGGITAPVVSATGNMVQFTVPVGVLAGVTIVSAANPGEQADTVPLRIRGQEICGNTIDEDCDGQLNDPDVCTPVNHAPAANAGPGQTAPLGATVQLDGS